MKLTHKVTDGPSKLSLNLAKEDRNGYLVIDVSINRELGVDDEMSVIFHGTPSQLKVFMSAMTYFATETDKFIALDLPKLG